jgi:hypothetical protein
VVKIIERELRTISQLAPTSIRHGVVKEYRELAERAMRLQIPQSHAALLQGAKRVPPAEALRPTSKPVRSLMQAVQAIKQGRLPFLPKETRRAAQKLLDAVFSKKAAAQISRSTQIPRTIESNRLIPTAVQGMISTTRANDQPPPPLSGLLSRSLREPLADIQAPYGVGQAPPTPGGAHKAPVAAHDLPRLARTVPAFDTQGVATGGAFLSHADEDVAVITRSDSPLATPGEMAGGVEGPVPAPQSKSTRQPPATVADSAKQVAGVPTNVGAQQQSQTGGQMRVEGELRIPELGNIVSKFTGFMTDNGALT